MQELFEDLIARDEFQLEGMDIFSNILYMKEDFATLSHLAHKAVLIDKYRPETCCVIGNYYSLKGAHEKVRSIRVARINKGMRLRVAEQTLARQGVRCTLCMRCDNSFSGSNDPQ